jgi:hypothetical protein
MRLDDNEMPLTKVRSRDWVRVVGGYAAAFGVAAVLSLALGALSDSRADRLPRHVGRGSR